MSGKDGIPMEEWLAELQRLSMKSAKGLTAAEWAKQMDVSIHTARLRLKEAQVVGWLVVGRRSTISLDGKTATSPVYQIVRPKGGKR